MKQTPLPGSPYVLRTSSPAEPPSCSTTPYPAANLTSAVPPPQQQAFWVFWFVVYLFIETFVIFILQGLYCLSYRQSNTHRANGFSLYGFSSVWFLPAKRSHSDHPDCKTVFSAPWSNLGLPIYTFRKNLQNCSSLHTTLPFQFSQMVLFLLDHQSLMHLQIQLSFFI